MHLAKRDADGPLIVAEVSEAIEREIQALSDAHACGAHEKQRGGFKRSPFAKLITNEEVILGRERPGKVLVLLREIPANDEVFSYTVSSFVRKVSKTSAQVIDLVDTAAITKAG